MVEEAKGLWNPDKLRHPECQRTSTLFRLFPLQPMLTQTLSQTFIQRYGKAVEQDGSLAQPASD